MLKNNLKKVWATGFGFTGYGALVNAQKIVDAISLTVMPVPSGLTAVIANIGIVLIVISIIIWVPLIIQWLRGNRGDKMGPIILGILGIIAIIIAVIWWQLSSDKQKHNTPSIVFLEPEYRYKLTFDPPHSMQIVTRPEILDKEKSVGYRLPVFRLKNLGKYVLRDINIEWHIPENILDSIVQRSERLRKYKTSIYRNSISMSLLSKTGMQTVSYRISFRETNSYPYLSPQIDNENFFEVKMPSRVFAILETAFLADVKDDWIVTKQIISKNFDVKIRYNENNQIITNQYKVLISAFSIKPWGNQKITIPIDDKMREPPEVMMGMKFRIS